MSAALTRADVVTAASRWTGTPYRHQASLCGVGCDCLGLVRGVWRDLIGDEPEPAPPYTPDWAEATGDETLLSAARQHLTERPIGEALAGDVLLFRMVQGAPAKHAGILIAPDILLHAYWGRSVCESRLAPWWRRRIAGAFSFPNVS